MPAGRPSSYRPEYCSTAEELGAQGMSKGEIAAHLGVCRETIHNWMNQHEEFFHAIKRAEAQMEIWFQSQFRRQATEPQSGNPASLIFMAKNQLPKVYRDRHDHHVDVREVTDVVIDYTGYDDDHGED